MRKYAPATTCLWGLLGLLALAPARPARAQTGPECAKRYADFFVRVPSVGLGPAAADQFRVNTEVTALFGARPDVCEAGGYQRFLDGFRDYAREAMRARGKQRDNLLRTAIAVLEISPQHVPEAEARSAVSAYRQVRSDLTATLADSKAGPMGQVLLDNLERVGAPSAQPAQVVPDSNVQTVRIPTSPLPPWVVISLYETLQAQKQHDYAVAQGKLEVVLKWLETAP